MKRTRKQIITGILDISAGILGSIIGAVIFLLSYTNIGHLAIAPIFMASGALLATLGILALVGGLQALYGKAWTLVLIGSICSAIFLPLTGIPAIVLTTLARDEYR